MVLNSRDAHSLTSKRAERGDQPFSLPVMRSPMIDRPHLLPANLPQLMLIRAPAGYGKTVAATQWAQRQPLDTHVLWVRGAAIRPSRFWHAMFESLSGYLEAESLLPLSLSQTLTGAESEATAEVQTKQLASLIDANVVLVIDNFEALTTPELDTRLVGMIEQSPGLKVMAISRRFSLLDGPLTKARLPTELITAGDLAFRQQEARALAQFYGPLGDEAVEALLEATAGWPLAVQAALSGRDLRIPQLVAGRMNLAYLPAQLSLIANDYLKLIDSENQRRALLAVAVCQGLSAKTFAETMIARSAEEDASSLYARTLKIFRELSDLGLITREWSPQANRYKCHEGLVSELRRRAHQELTKFELDRLVREHAVDLSVDDPFSAIMLYCEVGDFASADRLILGRPAEVAGVDHGLGEMMRSIPSEKLAGYPALACVRLVTGVFDRFTSDEWVRAGLEDLRNDVRSMFAEGLPQSEVSAASILLLVERMLGNQGLALSIARDLEQRLGELPKNLALSLGVSMPFMYSLLGFTAGINGEFDLADRCYGRAVQLAKQSGSLVEQIRALYGLALCACLTGETYRARQLAERAERLEDEWAEMGLPPVTFERAPVLVMLAAEQGDEVTVRRLRDELSPLRERLECWPLVIMAEAETNRRFRGDYAALSVLRGHLSDKDRVVATTPYLKHRLTVYTADLQMMLGNLASAEQQLQSLSQEHPDRTISTARVALLKGNPERASRILDDRLPGHPTRQQRCEYLLLSAVTSWLLGFHQEAVNDFTAAMSRMSESCGYRGLSKVPYDTLLALAQEVDAAGTDSILSRVLELPENMRCQQYEQLSPAELRTVEALVEGEPLEQTAAVLFISFNTLKFHLRNIYRKLRVTSREEAVRRAVRMGLLNRAPVRLVETEIVGGREGGKAEKLDIISD